MRRNDEKNRPLCYLESAKMTLYYFGRGEIHPYVVVDETGENFNPSSPPSEFYFYSYHITASCITMGNNCAKVCPGDAVSVTLDAKADFVQLAVIRCMCMQSALIETIDSNGDIVLKNVSFFISDAEKMRVALMLAFVMIAVMFYLMKP